MKKVDGDNGADSGLGGNGGDGGGNGRSGGGDVGGLITCIIACECDDSIWRQMTGAKKDAWNSGGLFY